MTQHMEIRTKVVTSISTCLLATKRHVLWSFCSSDIFWNVVYCFGSYLYSTAVRTVSVDIQTEDKSIVSSPFWTTRKRGDRLANATGRRIFVKWQSAYHVFGSWFRLDLLARAESSFDGRRNASKADFCFARRFSGSSSSCTSKLTLIAQTISWM